MRRLVQLAACVVVVACGGDGKQPVGPPAISRAGTYSLRTVDGHALPYAYPNAPGTELTAEALTLNGDNSFSARTDQRYTDANGQVHTGFVTSSGTYTVSGSDLTLRFSSGEAVGETFTGPDEITGHCCGSVWVYRR